MTAAYRPVVLCVLDGWGQAPDSPSNAATRAATPRLDAILRDDPHATLEASGTTVGLPAGVMGNSEVGHLTMGAGYAEPQALETIDRSIADGSFFKNPALRAACAAGRGERTLHLMGLLSTGGVHADMRHLAALLDLARREDVRNVFVHAFLDGRDMPPRSALPLIGQVAAPIATVHGRFYAMDRDKRWDRTERSYRAIVDAEGPSVPAAEDALRDCYAARECKDELMEPRVVGRGRPILDGDAVIFFNFRPDRARQLTWALMQPDFGGFERRRVPRGLTFVALTDYQVGLPDVRVAFPPASVIPLAQVVADHGLRQLHIAETEKYAHVTYF
ncbi:MAG TPA: 2,3-bisphosphoglycerate-independent phosphoglycerate mutase, partial [Candidatus Limnocylindria bacterium]|nr:2,3-bisphosphoglycerate-independent phosphoglycerate mutase [Candidatus Limnocylindria bacterium]